MEIEEHNGLKCLLNNRFFSVTKESLSEGTLVTLALGKSLVYCKITGPYPKNNHKNKMSIQVNLQSKEVAKDIECKAIEEKVISILEAVLCLDQFPSSTLLVTISVGSHSTDTVS